MRELLMDLYSKRRHSVNCRIMCRLPKKVLLVKAKMLQDQWLVLPLGLYCQRGIGK